MIHNWADADAIHSSAAVPRKELEWAADIDPGRPLIANVSRFGPVKRRGDLVEAMPIVLDEYPDAVAIIAGWGRGREAVEQRIEERGLEDSVRSIGELDNPYPVYAQAEVSVLTSSAESFGLSLLEAALLETPIVATDIPAFREVLGDDHPLVPPGDPGQLGLAIRDRLSNSAEASEIAARTRQRVEEQFWFSRCCPTSRPVSLSRCLP